MKLSRFEYDEEDDDLPTCFWLGGGKTSQFYEIPYFLKPGVYKWNESEIVMDKQADLC